MTGARDTAIGAMKGQFQVALLRPGQMERELVADRVAEQVHDCLGRLLANVVVEGAKLTNAEKKEIR